MGKFTRWAKNHKGTLIAIATGVAAATAAVVWGLLPAQEQPVPVKEEWIPPVKKNWYFPSDD